MKRAIVLLAILVVAAAFVSAGPAREAGAEHRIGLAFDIGGLGDQSFNDSAYRGLQMIAEEFNGFIADDPNDTNFGDAVEIKYLEPREGGQDREVLLRTLAEDGYEIIYAIGFLFTDPVIKVAADFPGTHFVLIDGFIDGLGPESNVTCVSFAEHEGSFLIGALAGLFTADRAPGSPIGFLGGMDIPLIHKFEAGYLAGAMYVNPTLRDPDMIFAQYIGQDGSAFSDPQAAEAITENFFNRGVFITYHAAGSSGTGLFKAAADADRWAIGVDSDQGLILASSSSSEERMLAQHILSSMLKRVDNSVLVTAEDFLADNHLDGGYITLGLAEGGVDFAVNEFNSELVAPYVPQLDELRQMVIDGEIPVPDHEDQLYDWAEQNL